MTFGEFRKLIPLTTFVWIENTATRQVEAGKAAFLSTEFDRCQIKQVYPSKYPTVLCEIGITVRV